MPQRSRRGAIVAVAEPPWSKNRERVKGGTNHGGEGGGACQNERLRAARGHYASGKRRMGSEQRIQ